jgi:hypothetical protein
LTNEKETGSGLIPWENYMNNNSQKEKEAKRKKPMRLWILPLMWKLMDSAYQRTPQFPQSLGQPFGLPTVPTITRLLRSCSFLKTTKPDISILVKSGHFYFGLTHQDFTWIWYN